MYVLGELGISSVLFSIWLVALVQLVSTSFYDNPEQDVLPLSGPEADEELHRRWDFEWAFSGISTFGHLKHVKCLSERGVPFDIGIIGAPFDTAVSYRPDPTDQSMATAPLSEHYALGARFGPRAIRSASARQLPFRAFNPRRQLNPYTGPYEILDCGDIPISPFDNALALQQMTSAFLELGSRTPALSHSTFPHPKLMTLGGDHSLALPALRALNKVYGGPIAVVHFDAHLDTWHPAKYPSPWDSKQSDFTHGSMFWIASNEGLIVNGSSVHGGLRSRLLGWEDYEDDERQGFLRIAADDIDEIGTRGIIDLIMERVGKTVPVYLSVDIDVVDPGLCPGTGTPEAGGWTSREIIRILRGLEGLNVVGADVVEVSPAYDGPGEQTALVAAQVVYEIITSWVGKGMTEIKDADQAAQREETRDEL